LSEAQRRGSTYATSLLGSYYNGSFDKQAGTSNFFVPRNPNQAAGLFRESAKQGNPIAMVLLAREILDPSAGLEFNKADVLALYAEAEGLKYPEAYTAHADAFFSQTFDNRPKEQRNIEAVSWAERASCIDPSQTDRWFDANRFLKKYRSNEAPACN
jgi:TPR repeat protein